MRSALLILSALLLQSCSTSEESRVEATIDDLVSALNSRDRNAATRLYDLGKIDPTTDSQDTSVIYAFLYTRPGEDFRAENISAVVVEDLAEASFDLSGDVKNGDSVSGRMSLRLVMQLEKIAGEWKIVSGSESRR